MPICVQTRACYQISSKAESLNRFDAAQAPSSVDCVGKVVPFGFTQAHFDPRFTFGYGFGSTESGLMESSMTTSIVLNSRSSNFLIRSRSIRQHSTLIYT